jgi:hypothetical protein
MAEEETQNTGQEATGEGADKKEKKPEPVIHVMPPEFHAASGKRVALSEPKDRKKEEGKKEGTGAAAGQERGRRARRGGGKGKAVMLILLAVLILGGGGFGAYYFFYMRPASTPPVNALPSGPVCGDGKCESPESVSNCAADCKPAAKCGDGECQASAGETKENCSQDCGEPDAVCGDGKCEESKGEDYQTCSDDCEPPAPTPAADIDSDGLSDIEENRLYGTNAYSADSDGDSFVDLNELLNLFNPAQPQPSTLLDNSGVTGYQNQSIGFQLIQPTSWSVSEAFDGSSVTLTATTGETISVKIDSNEDAMDLLSWYLKANPSVSGSSVDVSKTKQGYDHILSDDQLTAYVAVDGNIYTIDYELNQQLLIRYKATFKMIISSLKEL